MSTSNAPTVAELRDDATQSLALVAYSRWQVFALADAFELLTETLQAIEDGEGDHQEIARQTLEQLGIPTLEAGRG